MIEFTDFLGSSRDQNLKRDDQDEQMCRHRSPIHRRGPNDGGPREGGGTD